MKHVRNFVERKK